MYVLPREDDSMWRPRLPRHNDPEFWPVAAILIVPVLLLSLTNGAPIVPTGLVCLAFLGILWIIRR